MRGNYYKWANKILLSVHKKLRQRTDFKEKFLCWIYYKFSKREFCAFDFSLMRFKRFKFIVLIQERNRGTKSFLGAFIFCETQLVSLKILLCPQSTRRSCRICWHHKASNWKISWSFCMLCLQDNHLAPSTSLLTMMPNFALLIW